MDETAGDAPDAIVIVVPVLTGRVGRVDHDRKEAVVPVAREVRVARETGVVLAVAGVHSEAGRSGEDRAAGHRNVVKNGRCPNWKSPSFRRTRESNRWPGKSS